MAAFPGSSLSIGMEPVVAVSTDRGTRLGTSAFIELRTPEMATVAQHLNGHVTLFGRAMSVGRPRDYVDLQQLRQDLQVGGYMGGVRGVDFERRPRDYVDLQL